MSTTVPQSRPRARKSIANLPSPDIISDKENAASSGLGSNSSSKASGKKSRSKSIGPGGLDALKEDSGNRQKSALIQSVKSILKPTISLSPPKQIPPHPSARKASPSKGRRSLSPSKKNNTDTLIDTSIPTTNTQQSGLDDLPNPFLDFSGVSNAETAQQSQPTRVNVRTEEEQQIAARERERKEALAHRDARRKSLANRRVSFAPEATLHTWDVVELPEEMTTSSASTNSTGRVATPSGKSLSPERKMQAPVSSLDPSEPPSTPPEQVEEPIVTVSPAHQRDLHQKKRRRSSGIPPMNFNNPEDFSSSPTSSLASDDTSNHNIVVDDDDSSDSNDNDLAGDESTELRIDTNDLTSQSIASAHSDGGSSTSSSDRLDEALRQAAKQAGTKGIEHDENSDLSMEIADEEVTASFKPWLKKGKYTPTIVGNPSALQDQENLNPFSPAFKASVESDSNNGDDHDETMEFTQAAGAILPVIGETQGSPVRGRRKSKAPTVRRNSVARRRSSGDDSVFGDETMELTTAVGGIEPQEVTPKTLEESRATDDDEDLTMELTNAVGGLVNQNYVTKASMNSSLNEIQDKDRRTSIFSMLDEEDMDMTTALGGVLSSITEHTEPEEDQTMDMDITTAMGAILPKQLSTGNKSVAKFLMEREVDAGQLTDSPLQNENTSSPQKPRNVNLSRPPRQSVNTTSEAGSPSSTLTKDRRGARKSVGRKSTTPKNTPGRSSPLKKPSTPSKQLTPKPERPTTPGKTPPSKNVMLRKGSPKKLFKTEIRKANASPKPIVPSLKLEHNTATGAATPSIILTPRTRRSSGLGIDKAGLGSPLVAALLDRRRSIGEQAESFTPQGQTGSKVRFEDARAMEQELERERAEDERRESGRGILQQEADLPVEEEKDVTANLKDMIDSLTPKKNKLKGRKSLAVGGARGLLGKRPAELDVGESDEERQTPKRLKGQDKTPVKNIKLPAPPSKNETTGRNISAPRFSLGPTTGNLQVGTPSIASTPKGSHLTTPKGQSRFTDAESHSSATKPPTPFGEKLLAANGGAAEPPEEEDRIHLQDFLNFTSIRFMELTTTKRRHTIAPNAMPEDSAKKGPVGLGESAQDASRELENCVVAGACTIPMLELYQHSCRELKRYISEGRNIVREIEADTFEENPPLFREYMAAAPDVKAIMDTQFKNVKTHARLLSKAMWYEWRMKLLDGLKEGLTRIGGEMDEDAKTLRQQEQLLETTLPPLIEEFEKLESECQVLQTHADEMASYDQEELKDARENIASLEEAIEAKQRLLMELQQQSQEKQQGIEQCTFRRQACLDEISQAEKTCEECQGWSRVDVAALRARVASLEKSSGWTIASASGPTVTMVYRQTLQLFFTPSSFRLNNVTLEPSSPGSCASNTPISLSYISSSPLSTEKRFFLQNMRAQLLSLPQSHTRIQDMLGLVRGCWADAEAVAESIRLLGLRYITDVSILSDDVLGVKATVLLREKRAKASVRFEVDAEGESFQAEVREVYGEGINERRAGEWLSEKIGKAGEIRQAGGWVEAVFVLEERLKGRGVGRK